MIASKGRMIASKGRMIAYKLEDFEPLNFE